MPITRRHFLATGAAALAPGVARAQFNPEAEIRALWSVASGYGEDFLTGIGYFVDRGTPQSAPGLIVALRYTQHPPDVISGVLASLTGETEAETWFDWMLWQEANPQITPNAAYAPFKRAMMLRLDPGFATFFQPQFLSPGAMAIRLEEVTWGGVAMDGLVSLDAPAMIAAGEAAYLDDDDLVFGLSINGDARAYPLRILGWHEMMNDIVGGVPVALAYCTLCGAGIVFETGANADQRFVFGSSGLLYRSNKLMFDRQTNSLWNQFTGAPVMGPLGVSGIALPRRPVVVERWGAWRAANPDTSVLSLDTGFLRDYGEGQAYADYFASPDLMFPARVAPGGRAAKDSVFAVQTVGAAKAWPMAVFAGGRVLNDSVGGEPVVLIGDAGTGAVRAYTRGDQSFAAGAPGTIMAGNAAWRITEAALIGPDGDTLPRLPGHVSFWFAWDGYFGGVAELYTE